MRPILHRDLRGIVLSLTVYGVGTGLVQLFVPLLLLNRGAALWQICLLYVAYSVCKLLINFSSAVLINRHGARLGMAAAFVASALQLILLDLYVSGVSSAAILAVPACMAAMNSFLWNSQHMHISRVMDEGRTSRDMAFMQSAQSAAGMIAPLIGGLIGAWLGPTWLVSLALVIVLAAILPIRHMDALAGGHEPMTRVRYGLRSAHPRDVVGNVAFNIHGAVATMVWPVYLALTIGRFEHVGAIATASGATAFLVLFVAGLRGERHGNRRVLLEGTALLSLTHLGRLLAHGLWAVTGISAIAQTVLQYQFVPWISIYYAHSRIGGIDYIMSMEIAADVTYIALWSLLSVIAYLHPGTLFFMVSFVVAATAVWTCMLVTDESEAPPRVRDAG